MRTTWSNGSYISAQSDIVQIPLFKDDLCRTDPTLQTLCRSDPTLQTLSMSFRSHPANMICVIQAPPNKDDLCRTGPTLQT